MSDQESKPVVVLCPGQGAQAVGMGRSWAQRFPIAAQTFEQAGQILGMDLTKLCFGGPQEQLNRTDVAQAAIYVCSVACWRSLRQEGGLGSVAAAAGLSLGEFTALHMAEAFDFETGLKLVRLRGQAMQAAAEATASGMVALIGADASTAEDLCRRAVARVGPRQRVLAAANFNCPGQVVISGTAAACAAAIDLAARQEGLQAVPLAVAGAFHSPLMQPAADRLAEALDQATWAAPAVPVLSNVTGQPHDSDIDAIKRRLVEQVTQPVRWEADMRWIIEHLPSADYAELAPGKVLAGLMRRIDRSVKVTSHPEAA